MDETRTAATEVQYSCRQEMRFAISVFVQWKTMKRPQKNKIDLRATLLCALVFGFPKTLYFLRRRWWRWWRRRRRCRWWRPLAQSVIKCFTVKWVECNNCLPFNFRCATKRMNFSTNKTLRKFNWFDVANTNCELQWLYLCLWAKCFWFKFHHRIEPLWHIYCERNPLEIVYDEGFHFIRIQSTASPIFLGFAFVRSTNAEDNVAMFSKRRAGDVYFPLFERHLWCWVDGL